VLLAFLSILDYLVTNLIIYYLLTRIFLLFLIVLIAIFSALMNLSLLLLLSIPRSIIFFICHLITIHHMTLNCDRCLTCLQIHILQSASTTLILTSWNPLFMISYLSILPPLLVSIISLVTILLLIRFTTNNSHLLSIILFTIHRFTIQIIINLLLITTNHHLLYLHLVTITILTILLAIIIVGVSLHQAVIEEQLTLSRRT